MKSVMRLVAVVAALFPLTACGSSSSSNDPGSSAAAETCRRAFEATVTSGPDAHVGLYGDIVLTPTTDANGTSLTGYVDPVAAPKGQTLAAATIKTRVPLTGTQLGDQLSLRFTLPDGRTMQGTGTMPTSTFTCPNAFSGTLTGPAAGDVGNWGGGITVPTPPGQ